MNTYEVIWTRLAEKIKGSRRGGKRKKEWTKPELLALMRDLELEALKENREELRRQPVVDRPVAVGPEDADHLSTAEASISNDAHNQAALDEEAGIRNDAQDGPPGHHPSNLPNLR